MIVIDEICVLDAYINAIKRIKAQNFSFLWIRFFSTGYMSYNIIKLSGQVIKTELKNLVNSNSQKAFNTLLT